MKDQKDFQVVIAGAGPGGALLARQLAAAGVSVAVYELKKEGTLGHNWSDAVEKALALRVLKCRLLKTVVTRASW
jgi:flavin-dependent dehydrogenase